MCYCTQLYIKIKQIEQSSNARFLEPEAYSSQEETNAFSIPKIPVISAENRDAVDSCTVDSFRHGLKMRYSEDDAEGAD